jgi:hypothetical protein
MLCNAKYRVVSSGIFSAEFLQGLKPKPSKETYLPGGPVYFMRGSQTRGSKPRAVSYEAHHAFVTGCGVKSVRMLAFHTADGRRQLYDSAR